jgi:hypothetical protein
MTDTTTARGRRMLAGTAALTLCTLAVAPAASAANNLDFHHRKDLPLLAADFTQGQCPAPPAGQFEGGTTIDGWHFIVPANGTFATLTAVFDTEPDNDQQGDLTRTEADWVQHPDASHAYVYAPQGSLLVSAEATGSGARFNLSHTCAGLTVPDPDPEPETPTPDPDPEPETPKPDPDPEPETPKPEPEPDPETPNPETPKPEIPGTTEPTPEVDDGQTEGDGVVDSEEDTDDPSAQDQDASRQELAATGGSLAIGLVGASLLAGGAALSAAARRRSDS